MTSIQLRVAVLIAALALLPARVSGQATQGAPGLLPEPRALKNAINFVNEMKADDGRPSEGVYPELGQMVTGAGWISLGPGYRHRLFAERALVDVSAAVSWRFYKVAQARFEFPGLAQNHLAIGVQGMWRDMTQVTYFGAGPDSSKAERSDYRLQTTNVVGYATVRSDGALALSGSAGWLSRPTVSSSTGPFDRDVPDTTVLFAHDPAAAIARQPSFFHANLAVTHDTRNHRGHPTAGGFYRGGWVGFRDREDGTYTFARYETEAAHFVPVAGDRWVLAMHGLGVFSLHAASRIVPFYLLPSLGGNNTLRGYADYRFHDRHLLVANVESRWALLTHLDGALFFDAGNVAARIRDLDLARTSYGAGVRLHTGKSTLARLDVARSHEGWRVMFRMSDPLRLTRVTRRTAAMPFVP